KGQIIGAIVVAYAQTAKNAQQDRTLLGTEIAYYDGKSEKDSAKQVLASSFTRGVAEEDTAKARELTELLKSELSDSASKAKKITIDGVDYWAAPVKMPRSYAAAAGLELGADYPPVTAGAVVMAPLVAASNAGTVKMFVLLVGIGALAIAMLGV